MGNIQTVGLNEAVLISGEGDKQTSKLLLVTFNLHCNDANITLKETYSEC